MLNLDATSAKTWLECKRKWQQRFEFGWVLEAIAVALFFGRAWHGGIHEFYRQGGASVSMMMQAFLRSAPPLEQLSGAYALENVERAFGQYREHSKRLGVKEVLEIEQWVEVELEEGAVWHCKLDMLGVRADGKVWVVEHKHTKQASTAWMNQWAFDLQMLGYLVVGKKAWGGQFGGVLVDAAVLRTPPKLKKDGTPYANSGKGNEFFLFPLEWGEQKERVFRDSMREVVKEIKEGGWRAPSFQCARQGRLCEYFWQCLARPEGYEAGEPVPLGFKQVFWVPGVGEVVGVEEEGE